MGEQCHRVAGGWPGSPTSTLVHNDNTVESILPAVAFQAWHMLLTVHVNQVAGSRPPLFPPSPSPPRLPPPPSRDAVCSNSAPGQAPFTELGRGSTTLIVSLSNFPHASEGESQKVRASWPSRPSPSSLLPLTQSPRAPAVCTGLIQRCSVQCWLAQLLPGELR